LLLSLNDGKSNSNDISGNSSRQFSYPQGIFIHHKTKLFYVSDSFNNRVKIFPLYQSKTTGTTLISQIRQDFKIYVDDDNEDFPTIYIAINAGNRVEKWVKGTNRGIQVDDRCLDCTGVWLDKEKNVYMTEHNRNRVLKWSSVTNITTIVAGETDKKGPGANHLNEPQGIFVDKTTNAFYIADLVNHRIQQWTQHAKVGLRIAGSDAKSLNRPYDLRVDEITKTLYVIDLLNNRIRRWKNGSTERETITGGNGMYIISFILFDELYSMIGQGSAADEGVRVWGVF
jgi:sugar lactone lactonase YvrE